MPSKIWVVGEEVLAPDFNTYVQQQVVAQFPTTAARGAGITTPVAGQPSYIDSNDANEGLEIWNGAAWRKPWSQPWGVIGAVSVGTPQTGFDTIARDIGGLAVTVSTTGNRRLKVILDASCIATVASTWAQFHIADGASTTLKLVTVAVNNGFGTAVHTVTLFNVAAGVSSVSFKGRVSVGTGNLNTSAASNNPLWLIVEDVGPIGAPT